MFNVNGQSFKFLDEALFACQMLKATGEPYSLVYEETGEVFAEAEIDEVANDSLLDVPW